MNRLSTVTVFLAFTTSAAIPIVNFRLGKAGKRTVDTEEAALEVQAKKLSIFCFAWTPFSARDQGFHDEKVKQFEMCDGHAFFTDKDSPTTNTNLIKVAVPKQSKNRTQKEWLSHRNMAGLIPSWTHLLRTMMVDEKYDWVINSEMDHFMRPSMVRLAIASHLATLRNGTEKDRESTEDGKPLMLMFGNSFAFNKAMVKEMKRQWWDLQRAQPEASNVSGCPSWMEGKWRWKVECAQDVVYPIMAAEQMKPAVAMYGNAGCGKFAVNSLGQQLRLGCWEIIQSPSGHGSEKMQLQAIREIALMPENIWSNETDTYNDRTPQFVEKKLSLLSTKPTVASQRFLSSRSSSGLVLVDKDGSEEDASWHVFYPGSQVPFIHHVGFPSVMALARELLGL